MRNIISTALIICLNFNGFGQDSLDVNLFTTPDMTFSLRQEFFNGDSVLFVIPDKELSKADSTVLVACMQSSRLIRESELKEEDYNKKLHVWGEVSEFKNFKKFGMPIKQTEKGFGYYGLTFENTGNSMFYINSQANRLAYIGNSIQAIDPIRRSLLGSYQVYVFNNNLIVYNGNEGDSLNDLANIRKEYFANRLSSKYFNISLGKEVVVPLNLENKLDSFIDTLAILIGVNTHDYQKLYIYLYNHVNDVAYLSGMPSPFLMHGINVNNIAHASALDIETIQHESTHWLIHQKIGANTNNFYVEGFRQCTEYLFDKVRLKEDLEVTKAHTDLLTFRLINGDSGEFFSSPKNYPISGVVVYFLIDTIGFDTFKEYYGKDLINELLYRNHNIKANELINSFKEWIE